MLAELGLEIEPLGHHCCLPASPPLPTLLLPHCAILCLAQEPFIDLPWKTTHIYSVWADYHLNQIEVSTITLIQTRKCKVRLPKVSTEDPK